MNTSVWISRIDQTTSDFESSFNQLTTDQLNWQPNATTWSIAQNIDHLIVINKTYFPVIEELKAGRYQLPWTARFGFLVNFFGKFILKAATPNRKNRTKTFPIWEPTQSSISESILADFKKHQEELKEVVINSQDLIQAGAVISSPANKYIVYQLATAFEIITLHEQRHLEQAKEVLAVANFGS